MPWSFGECSIASGRIISGIIGTSRMQLPLDLVVHLLALLGIELPPRGNQVRLEVVLADGDRASRRREGVRQPDVRIGLAHAAVDGEVDALAPEHPAEPRRLVQELELDRDAGRLELLGDHLATELVLVVVHHRDLEPVRVARLGQELLGLRDVVLVARHAVRHVRVALGDGREPRLADAVVPELDQLLPVDRVGDRLAHLDVVEWLHGHVHHEDLGEVPMDERLLEARPLQAVPDGLLADLGVDRGRTRRSRGR